MNKSKKLISAKEFDEMFDSGKSVTKYLGMKSIKAHYPVQRVNVDMPKDMLQKVGREAAKIGVPRTSLHKMWIAKRLHHSPA